MNLSNQPPTMSQKIFNLDLSMETVSVYLMCCSLHDEGTTLNSKILAEMWNSDPEKLDEGLKDLERLNIIRKIISDGTGNDIYQLSDHHRWKT